MRCLLSGTQDLQVFGCPVVYSMPCTVRNVLYSCPMCEWLSHRGQVPKICIGQLSLVLRAAQYQHAAQLLLVVS
jgi:hypothetical protein